MTERNADDQTSSRSMSYGYGDKVLETKNQNIKAGFYYNAEGQMVGKTTQFKTSIYSWDGNVLAADDLTVFTNEAHVTGGVPIMASDQNVMISDYLGNTLSSGNTQFTSSAYGEGLEQGRFTGKAFLKELGEFVFQHRNYSAETLRWTVTDPSGFPDGKNNFLYVHGDPLTSFDSRGLDTNWIFNGEVTNNTNCSGTNGWTIIISADADTIELKNSSGAQVWKHEGWTEAESDSWKDAADTYIAAHPGATKIIGLSGVQNKDLPAAKSALDIGIEDADFVVSSPHPVSKAECRGAVLTLPAEGKIGWSNWTIYEK